jgi:hypothetical protein
MKIKKPCNKAFKPRKQIIHEHMRRIMRMEKNQDPKYNNNKNKTCSDYLFIYVQADDTSRLNIVFQNRKIILDPLAQFKSESTQRDILKIITSKAPNLFDLT